MGGDLTQPQTALPANAGNDRLDSWKEIATYLKKEVRTVQRWEKSAGLPVRSPHTRKVVPGFCLQVRTRCVVEESESKLEIEDVKAQEELDGFELEVTEFVPSAEELETSRVSSPRLRRVIIVCSVVAVLVRGSSARGVVLAPDSFPVVTKMILAVRPFKNLSGDSGQDFIADGMTEEMVTRLGQMHPEKMGVIRLSPAYISVGLGRIGNEVRAQYVLEGGVRRSGQKVAITAQVIQVSDQTQVWGESYERDLQDLLRMESEVARIIAIAVLNKVPEGQPSPDGNNHNAQAIADATGSRAQAQTRQVNGDAYLAYLEGRYSGTSDRSRLRQGDHFVPAIY